MSERTCFEVVGNLDEVMRDELTFNVPYFVLGGIATKAYASDQTYIDKVDRIIYTTDEADEPTFRDNRTKRDVDILVGDVIDPDKAEQIKRSVSDAIDDELEVSVFSLDVYDPHNSKSPLTKLFKGWTSRRSLDEAGVLRLELFPAQVEISPTVLEPWTLVTPDQDRFSVMHPAAHLMNYATRSASGVRHKDVKKLAKASSNLLADSEFQDELIEGDLSSLAEFAGVIDALRDGKIELGDPRLHPDATEGDLKLAKFKGNFLRWLESHDKIVDLALQGPIQKILKPFVGNA